MIYLAGVVATVVVMLAVLLMLGLVPLSPTVVGGMFLALIVAGAFHVYPHAHS